MSFWDKVPWQNKSFANSAVGGLIKCLIWSVDYLWQQHKPSWKALECQFHY